MGSNVPFAPLDIDFAGPSASGYLLSRAGSATFINSSGLVATALTDVARIQHSTASGNARLGLLVEAAATNLALRSEELSNTTTWTNLILGLGVNPVRVADNATAPDGTLTADTLTFNCGATSGSGNISMIRQSLSSVAGVTYTFSIWLRGTVGGEQIQLRQAAGAGYTLFTLTTSWTRCTVTEVAFGASFELNVGIRQSINGVINQSATVEAWGAQLEVGGYASSYIATTTATAPRAEDQVRILTSAVQNWGRAGALLIDFYPVGTIGTIVSTDGETAQQLGIEASTTTAVRAFWSSGSVSASSTSSGVQRYVHAWNGTASRGCLNGGPVNAGTNNAVTSDASFITLGSQATDSGGVPNVYSAFSNCVIGRIRWIPGMLSDQTLQSLTSA